MNIKEIIKQVTGKDLCDSLEGKRQEWLRWYTGKVKGFHNYRVWNGTRKVPMERMSLGMPKKLCEDWANLLLNEKTDIVLSDANAQDIISKVLVDNHFWNKGNGAVEKYMALGIGAIVEGVRNLQVNDNGDIIGNGEVYLQLINGTKVYPISFENDKVVECAFVNENPNKALVSIHLLNETGEYDIMNVVCKGDNAKSYTYDLRDITILHTRKSTPWFQILKPNIENNLDINSPLGISIFANAIDVLKSVDLTYDSMYNELNLGRKRIFISSRQMKTDLETGETIDVFDQSDIDVYALPESEDGKTIISNDTQPLRTNEIDTALQRQINLLCSKCGFGVNYIRMRPGGEQTATQVISENSEMYRNLRKHEIVLEDALVNMVKALIEILNDYCGESIREDVEVKVQFDDSIIEDKETEKTSDRTDLTNGIISKAEYRAKWYAEDLEQAEEKIKAIAVQNNDRIITELTAMSGMISKETYLELNPYIEDAKAELNKINKEAESTIRLLTDEELGGVNAGTQEDTENTNAVGENTSNRVQ